MPLDFKEIPFMDPVMAIKMKASVDLTDIATKTDIQILEKMKIDPYADIKTSEKLLNAIRLARRNYLGEIKGFKKFRNDLSDSIPGFPTNATIALFFGGIKTLKDIEFKQGPNDPNLRGKAYLILDEARSYWQFSGDEIPTVWLGILSALAKFNPGDGIGPSIPREP